MSCCLTPERSLVRTVKRQGSWCVVATCATCGADRQESVFFDDYDAAHECEEHLPPIVPIRRVVVEWKRSRT